jgi:hypothetical protein
MTFYNHEKMKALTIASKCADAYSADAWGPVAWVEAAQMLLDMNFTEEEVESLLRSKMTRWARDAFGEKSTYLGALYQNVMAARRNGRIKEYIS